MAFQIPDRENQYRWQQYVCFKNGISPREFRRNLKKDIVDCIEIDNAIHAKGIRQKKINDMMAKVKF